MKIIELAKEHEDFYVKLGSEEVAKKFLEQAESEGFTFGDGVKPTERDWAEYMAVHDDMTINYVGYIGMMKVQSGQADIVDFEQYTK